MQMQDFITYASHFKIVKRWITEIIKSIKNNKNGIYRRYSTSESK